MAKTDFREIMGLMSQITVRRTDAEGKKAKPDWDAIFEEVKEMKSFPVDKFILENKQLMFPSSKGVKLIKEDKTSTGERIVLYRIERQSNRMDITFVLPKEAEAPSFNRYMENVFFSIIAFALAQQTLKPFVKKEHQNKLLGNKSFYKHSINDILQTLTQGFWDYTNNKRGKEYRRHIGHILNSVDFYGKGRGSYYRAEINPLVAQAACAIIEGKEKIPSYVPYPLQELTSLPTRVSRIRQHFLTYQGLHSIYPLQVRTFLSKMGVTKGEMKNKSTEELLEIADKGLAEVKKLGFDWEVDRASYPFAKLLPPETIEQSGLTILWHLSKDISKLKKENPKLELGKEKPFSLVNRREFLKLKLIFRKNDT